MYRSFSLCFFQTIITYCLHTIDNLWFNINIITRMFKHLVVTALDHHCIRHSLEVNIHYTPCHNHFVKMISPSQKTDVSLLLRRTSVVFVPWRWSPQKRSNPRRWVGLVLLILHVERFVPKYDILFWHWSFYHTYVQYQCYCTFTKRPPADQMLQTIRSLYQVLIAAHLLELYKLKPVCLMLCFGRSVLHTSFAYFTLFFLAQSWQVM